MADPLPSADEFRASLAPPQNQLPSADQFRASLQPQATPGPLDHDLLAAAARGFAQGASTPLDPETVQSLRDVGILPDYQKGTQNLVRSFNQALFDYVAAPLYHLGTGAYGAVRAMAEAQPDDLVSKGISAAAGAATGMMEAFPAGHFTGLPVPAGAAESAPVESAITAPEEEPFAGQRAAVAALNPENAQVRVQPPPGNVDVSVEIPPQPGVPESETGTAAAAPNIHEIAGQIAPDLFHEYDALAEQQNALRASIDQLATMRDQGTSPAINDLDKQIDTLRSQRLEAAPQERPAMADQITALEDQRAKMSDALPKEGDTPDMTALRQQLTEADLRRRDLSEQVRATYRQAAEQGNAPILPPEAASAGAPEAAAAPEAPEAPVVVPPAETEATPAAPQAPAVEPQAQPVMQAAEPIRGAIAADVSRQLVAAGRPEEEATAAGALVQAHYQARAANLEGTTPEGLYREEAPQVKAGRGVKPATAEAEFAQPRRGKIRLADPETDARATITLFKDADASTFIHETGHAWLEELTRDAQDDRARPQVKADAATVRDWLEVGDGEEIPRAAHEKFARGFERYMMEGHAPSAGLASVFAKFKAWLTQIYQTVSRLRSPINPDIRAVFDRMLATPDEGTVIAPGEPTRTFADMHEAEAEAAQPPEAGAIAPLVRDERDRIGEAAHPEIEDERVGARAPDENGGSPAGGGISGTGGNAAEPDAAAAGRISQSGEIGARGGDVAREGNPVPADQSADRAAIDRASSPAVARLAPSPDRLVDKAGNIRLDNLDTAEDVKQAIRESASRNGDFLGRRRGVVSDAQREALANVIGTTPDKILAKEIGQTFSDSEIKALERLFAQSSSNVRDLSIRFAQTESEADDMALAQAIGRHDMLQGLYSQATAEAGRAFRALRKSQQYWSQGAAATAKELSRALDDSTGRTFNQRLALARKIRELDQPGKISKFVHDVQKPGLFDWIQSFWTNALLSGPFTHLGYTAAGELFGLFRATAETGMAGAVGMVRRALGAETVDSARFGEMRAQAAGMLRGNIRGLHAAWQAVKDGQTVFPQEAEPQLFGDQGRAVGSRQVIPDIRRGGRMVAPIGTILESPSRLVSALHSFNWTTFYEQSKAAQAFRQAISEGIDPTTPAFKIRASYLIEHPSDDMIGQAIKDAGSGSLMQRPNYNSIMGHISQLANSGKHFPDIKLPGGHTLPLGTLRPVKFIDPFVQIQANIQKAAFGRNTPLALFSPEVRADLMFKNGGAAFDRTAGKILAGTAFAVGAGALYLEGRLNNSGPVGNPAQRAAWMRIHGMPHGLNIDGMSFDVLRLGVLGLQMSIAADLAHVAHHVGDEDAAQIAAELAMAFGQNELDESFLRGPSEIMQVVTDPTRYGAAWVRNFVSSFVPFSVGMSQIAHEIDPHTHRARSLMAAVMAKIPGVSEELPTAYDVWGEPVQPWHWAGTYFQKFHPDPVDQHLQALGYFPAMPQREIGGVQLTEQQYADYSRLSGRMAYQRVAQILNTPGINRLPPQAEIDVVRKTITASRRQAAAIIEMRSRGAPDDILAKRQAIALAAMHGATPDELKKMRQTVH